MEFIKKYKWVIIICFVTIALFYAVRNQKDTRNHVVNSLYKSDERIYRDYLGEDDRKMYDLIIDSMVKHRYSIKFDLDEFHCYDYEDCVDVITYANEALMVEHPEIMNYSGYSWSYHNDVFHLKLVPAYYLSYKDYYGVWMIEKTLSKIEKDTKDMNDREKIIYVYQWMGDHNTYDKVFTYMSKNQSIYNVFINQNAVCAGFARASQIIFSRIGIESYIVLGLTSDLHMWNIVKYEDHYYYFDSTVAVSANKDSDFYYSGLRQSFMNQYTAYHEDWYPVVEEKNMFEV